MLLDGDNDNGFAEIDFRTVLEPCRSVSSGNLCCFLQVRRLGRIYRCNAMNELSSGGEVGHVTFGYPQAQGGGGLYVGCQLTALSF